MTCKFIQRVHHHSSHILAVILACNKQHTFPLILLLYKLFLSHKSVVCSLDVSEWWQESLPVVLRVLLYAASHARATVHRNLESACSVVYG